MGRSLRCRAGRSLQAAERRVGRSLRAGAARRVDRSLRAVDSPADHSLRVEEHPADRSHLAAALRRPASRECQALGLPADSTKTWLEDSRIRAAPSNAERGPWC